MSNYDRPDPTRCIWKVFDGWYFHQCSRKRVVGEYCKQHDPVATKARQDEASRRYREKVENSPYNLLYKRCQAAETRIKALEQVLRDDPLLKEPEFNDSSRMRERREAIKEVLGS
jgi:hypothetical protein